MFTSTSHGRVLAQQLGSWFIILNVRRWVGKAAELEAALVAGISGAAPHDLGALCSLRGLIKVISDYALPVHERLVMVGGKSIGSGAPSLVPGGFRADPYEPGVGWAESYDDRQKKWVVEPALQLPRSATGAGVAYHAGCLHLCVVRSARSFPQPFGSAVEGVPTTLCVCAIGDRGGGQRSVVCGPWIWI
jgi:hypothetical protein